MLFFVIEDALVFIAGVLVMECVLKRIFVRKMLFRKVNILIYNDNIAFFNLNESPEQRKLLSFQTCFMLNQSKPFACTPQAGLSMWIKFV